MGGAKDENFVDRKFHCFGFRLLCVMEHAEGTCATWNFRHDQCARW